MAKSEKIEMPGCQDDDIPGDVPFDTRPKNEVSIVEVAKDLAEADRLYAERVIQEVGGHVPNHVLIFDPDTPFTHVNLEDGTITIDEDAKALEAHLDDIASRLLRGETDIDPVVDLRVDRITRLERSVNDLFGQRNADYGDAHNILTSRSRYGGDSWHPLGHIHNTLLELQERPPRCGLGPGDPCDPWTEVHNTIATMHGTIERLQERVDTLERACRRHGVNIETEYRPETVAAYHALQHPAGG